MRLIQPPTTGLLDQANHPTSTRQLLSTTPDTSGVGVNLPDNLVGRKCLGRHLKEFRFGDKSAVSIIDAGVWVGNEVSDAAEPPVDGAD